jgi:hypothetical protein
MAMLTSSPHFPGNIGMLVEKFRSAHGDRPMVTLVETPKSVLRQMPGHRADPVREEAFKNLYSGYRDLAAAELHGVVTNEGALQTDKVDAMFMQKVAIVRMIPYLFACVDISGGGDSETAVVIGAFDSQTRAFLVRFTTTHCLLDVCVCRLFALPCSLYAATYFLSTAVIRVHSRRRWSRCAEDRSAWPTFGMEGHSQRGRISAFVPFVVSTTHHQSRLQATTAASHGVPSRASLYYLQSRSPVARTKRARVRAFRRPPVCRP